MKYPKVSIIVLNWNGREDTIECLDFLKEIDYPNYEIIVVDNGSSDDSVEKIKEYKNQRIKLLTLNSNLGFAGGNNVGIKNALENGADYVLLLNNDTAVEKDFLSHLIQAAEEQEPLYSKKIGVLGPKIYFYDNPKQIWFAGGKINRILTKGEMVGYGEIDRGQFNEIKETDYITGCCLLIKREVIEKIGLMWDGYFLYYEDTDWSLKARQNGWKIIVAPKAKIYHKASRSTKEGSFSYIYYHSRNGLYLAKRNGSSIIRFCAYFLSIWIFIKQIIKLLFFPSKRIWVKAVMRGIGDFYLRKKGQI